MLLLFQIESTNLFETDNSFFQIYIINLIREELKQLLILTELRRVCGWRSAIV